MKRGVVQDDSDRVTWALDVEKAIEELPTPQASVLRLAYFERLPQARIAERLSLSRREVSAALAAALSELTARLGRPTAR